MRTRRIDVVGGWALLALSVLVVALAGTGLVRAAPEPLQVRASGALRISGSSGERAILSGSNLAPGGMVKGSVTIADRGSSGATLKLSALNLANGGGAGSPLAGDLLLTIRDATRGGDGIVYSGPLSGLSSLRAGALAPGERRVYAFTATLPDPGSGVIDDSLAGSWTRVDFGWKLSKASNRACAIRLRGDAGPNRLVGTVGGDRLSGEAGDDRLEGGKGNDCLEGGPGRDRIAAGPGNDRIRARDGAADKIDCGPGNDTAIVDRLDRTRNCEHVKGPKPGKRS